MLDIHSFATFIQSTPGPCVVINTENLKILQKSIQVLGVDKTVLTYPSVGQFPYDPATPSSIKSIERIKTIQTLKTDPNFCLLISPLAWFEKRHLLDDVLTHPLTIKMADTWTHTHLIDLFILFAYVKADVVELPGQYTVCGDRIDVFPPNLSHPIRIDFFGDTIEDIRKIDSVTQRSSGDSYEKGVSLYPATEYLIDASHIAYYKNTYAPQLTPTDQQMMDRLADRTTTKNIGHLWPMFYEISHHISHFWSKTPSLFLEPTLDLNKEYANIVRIYETSKAQGRLVLPPEQLFCGLENFTVQQSM